MKGVYLGNQKVSFLGATFRSYQPTFFPGEVVDVVIRPEDFDLVLDDPDKAIIQGIVTKTAFTGMTFNMWVNCNGTVLMVTDYQNAEVGERIGLSVDFYEIHMMKVADEDQPLEIRKIREEGRRLALEQEDK
ncbi:MAG: TOBE domain-containing protein [Bacilli bacterium]|nr:TOBE domain-containing protein [Bacilli bacterium]